MLDDNLREEARRQALSGGLVFIELKPEVADRLELPNHVPIFKQDLDSEIGKGQLPPASLAAGIEALKILKPDMQDYDRFLARYYLMEGQRALENLPQEEYDAQRNFQKALDLEVGELSAEAAFYLASLVREADSTEAERLYRLSIEFNPKAAAVYFELGKLLRERRDLPGALEQFEMAYRLEPESVNLLNEICDTHLMAENFGAARATFARAAELEPEYWLFPVKLGIADYEGGEYAAAIKHLRAGLDLAPDELEGDYTSALYLDGLYYLGMAFRESGDPARARKLFRAVLNLDPGHQGALEGIGG